jgi:pimeloyl-ACP methyl ester carboxylesterase
LKRILARGLTLALLGTLLAACTPQVESVDLPKPLVPVDLASELKPFYEQKVDWRPCAKRTFCADIIVPMDWANPAGETISIATAYRRAENAKPIGSLLFNPGGPGSSGYDWMADSIDYIGTPELRANYNIVGFDPRGVQNSAPAIKCLSSSEMDQFLYGDSEELIGSPADIAETRATMKDFIAKCKINTGPLLQYVDTVSAAKDLDIIRALMGDKKLNYLGFSYGTYLGATYAALYPTKVGRMVLDGAIDPTAPDSEGRLKQLVGFESALKAFLADCLKSRDCPFSGPVEKALRAVQGFLYTLETDPLPTDGDRKLTIWAAISGLIQPLYSEDLWPELSNAFTEAGNGEGTAFLALADAYNERADDGTYQSNATEANIAISCLDSRSPSDKKSMAAENKRIMAASPILGRYWLDGALGCEQWPYPVAKHPKSYAANGSGPILVIGTTGDPATPYSQAVSLARDVLENGHLLTYRGEGHTAYGRSNQCVENAVDNYLIKGKILAEDQIC